jgi:hypothetical protein
MATDYFSSQWEWGTVDQSVEMLTGATFVTRSNWTLTRHRWSNEPYISQYGTTEDRLIGYNAGVYNEIEGPSIYGVKFDTTTEWVDAQTLWVSNGGESASQPVYVQYLAENKPNGALVNVLWKSLNWHCGSFTRDDVEQFTGSTLHHIYQSSGGNLGDNPLDVGIGDWAAFAPSTPVPGYYPAPLLCESDQRSYDIQGVDWYKQTQRWIYKDSWS